MLQIDISNFSVNLASVPESLEGASARGVLWQSVQGAFLLNVPDVGRFLITAGSSITVETVPDLPASVLEQHLGMLPLAALLYQRGMLAFHAATVTKGRDAVMLAGDSGSGKSTLLTALLQRGWRMLGDDLTIVGLNEYGQPVVYPSTTGVSLWPESFEKLGIVSDSLSDCDANRRKYIPPEQTINGPLLLSSIYRLTVHSQNAAELETLPKNSCFRAVGTMLYNSHVAEVVCSKTDYLQCASAIAHYVPITILRRPRSIWSVEALAEIIMNKQREL